MKYDLNMIESAQWIDTCALARRTWPELPNHKLASLAKRFGIEYRAHDAAEDARAAGEILLLSIESKSTVNMRRRLRRTEIPIAQLVR